MLIIKRTQEEIEEVMNAAVEQEEQGGTKWHGMTYEQGIAAALNWILGFSNDNPMQDE